MKKVLLIFLYLVYYHACAWSQALTVTPAGPIDCYFNSQVLTANPSGAVSYDWYGTGTYSYCGAPDQFLFSGQSFLPVGGTYYCVATWPNTSTSVSNVVTIREMAQVPAMGPFYNGNNNHACQTTGLTLYMGPNYPSTCAPPYWDSYQWKRNGIMIPGANAMNYTALQTGYYSCVVSTTFGTALSDSVYIRIDQPVPPSTVITVDTLCGILTVPYIEGAAYQWFANNVQLYSNTATSNVYRNAPCYSGNFKCRITTDCGTFYTPQVYTNFCIQTETATLSAGGPVSFCPGGSVTLTVNSGPNKNVQWMNGSTAIPGANAYTYTATTSGNYYAVLTNQNGCTISSGALSVNANVPNASITPSGAVSFCPGDSVTLSAAAGPGYTYQWKKDTVTIPGATASTYKAKMAGAYTVRVTAPCGSATSLPLNVYTNSPNTSLTITGSLPLCSGTSVTLQVPSGYSAYQWSRNGVAIAGATSPSYTVNYGNGSGLYRASVTAGCGTGHSYLTDIYDVSPLTANLYVVGTEQLCTGQSTVLTTTGNPSALAFKWKKNNNNITGAKSSAFRVTQPGTYMVEVTGTCGTALSAPVTINVNSTMPASVTATGALAFCQGDSVTLSANTGIGLSYIWKKNNNVISAATSASYTAKTTGNFKVQVTNVYGCSGTSPITSVTAYGLPSATITPQGPTSFCLGDSVQLKTSYNGSWLYQWKKNNTNISGATSNKIYAKTAGSYKVKVTSPNGCSTISSPILISVPCRGIDSEIPENNIFSVEVSPNPSSGEFNIYFNTSGLQNVTITIYDISGKLLQKETGYMQNYMIKADDLTAGLYYAFISTCGMNRTVKLVKTD